MISLSIVLVLRLAVCDEREREREKESLLLIDTAFFLYVIAGIWVCGDIDVGNVCPSDNLWSASDEEHFPKTISIKPYGFPMV